MKEGSPGSVLPVFSVLDKCWMGSMYGVGLRAHAGAVLSVLRCMWADVLVLDLLGSEEGAASGNGLQVENRRTIEAGKHLSDPHPAVPHFHGSEHPWGGDPSAPWAAVPVALAG